MDCRKLAWLAGGLACLLVGCTRHEPQQYVPPQPPPIPKAPPQAQPVTTTTRGDRSSKDDPTVLDAKPSSCVNIGNAHAEVAGSQNVPAPEREQAAQRAKFAYQRALQIDPKYVPAHMAMGALCESIGQMDEALASFRTAAQVEPKNVPAKLAVIRVLEKAGNRADALATFRAALNADPREPELWYEQGMCLGRAKDFNAALASLKRAAELRPKYENYNKAVGLMLARMGRPDEAMPWLLAANMSEADARYNVAQMMRHIGRLDASQEQMALALQADPEHIPTLKLMSDFRPVPPASEPIRAAAYQEPAAPAAALPTRPAERRTQMPLIPVLSDNWDTRPSPPSLTNPAPRQEPKQRPNVSIGFETNP